MRNRTAVLSVEGSSSAIELQTQMSGEKKAPTNQGAGLTQFLLLYFKQKKTAEVVF